MPHFAPKTAFAALLALGVAIPLAKADPMVPTVIVDAATGEVLQSEEATRPWFPASTTKLMTAYVALKEIQRGTIKFETPLVVTSTASKQPPSKIGVKPGQEITVENALKVLMVKSANDIAIVMAEGIGGSVAGFSAMMNREAARLGMSQSHFVNPHGLHRDDHVSSARDMAILARALLVEFPQYSELWSIGAVQIGNRKFANTNGLIGRYPGAMGMKTGFVCASGFNLVSAAERGGRTLIAVVFGAASAADRTLKAAQLLDQGFSGGGFAGFGGGSRNGMTLASMKASIERTAPNRRAEICGRRGPPVSEEDSGAALAFTPSGGSSERPDSIMAFSSAGQSNTVGQRMGNRVALGPRDNFEPVLVYLGRKPGSTEVARRPGGEVPAPQTQAFAAEPKRSASGNPLALHGETRPAAAAGIGKAKQAPQRPAAAASLASRQPLKVEPVRAKVDPNTKVDPKTKADWKIKADIKATAKKQPAKATPAKTTPTNKAPEANKTGPKA